jgi:hypothetical protein
MNAFSQAWGAILPVRWYMEVLFGQAARGLPLADSARPFAALAALATIYSLLALLRLRSIARQDLAPAPAPAPVPAAAPPRGIGGAFVAEWRLAAEIAKAKSRLEYAEQQLSRTTTLARTDTATQQALDQAQNDAASARADVAEAQANHDAAVAGPTKEEREIADAQVKAAATALAVLERRLLTRPSCGPRPTGSSA